MEKPKTIKEIEKLFDETQYKLCCRADYCSKNCQREKKKYIKQFWLEHFKSLLEEMRMEDKPLVRRSINTFEDGQVYGEIDGYNERNAEINTAIQTLLGEGKEECTFCGKTKPENGKFDNECHPKTGGILRRHFYETAIQIK